MLGVNRSDSLAIARICNAADRPNPQRHAARGLVQRLPNHASRHGLYSQALATLGATCVQNSAAATGLHANAETVGTLATGNRGLVSAFHGVSKEKEPPEIAEIFPPPRRCPGDLATEIRVKPTISANFLCRVNRLAARLQTYLYGLWITWGRTG